MLAYLRNIRISPKKLNLVAYLIRGKKVQEALNILKFTPKKGAKLLYKNLKSAVANAENNFKQAKEELFIKKVLVSGGPTYSRRRPISRGRSHPIKKRTSHLTIEVGTK